MASKTKNEMAWLFLPSHFFVEHTNEFEISF